MNMAHEQLYPRDAEGRDETLSERIDSLHHKLLDARQSLTSALSRIDGAGAEPVEKDNAPSALAARIGLAISLADQVANLANHISNRI
jgi:hypothetical protein